ncbi:MAG: hypothetical protein KUA43_12965 [Hoeflea sp.]|uniref:Kazal-type serine protease inhibitor family protein n=1 Tax=Hoeflea sp. TaxID=1940281 RepID=UPI001D6A6AEB|nr:Kazal-type serine protease inhibitor [Hoeflea sp.]MBU4527923.1 hypothetical protein [Alphaproteobacteria bacterium]MBU4546042.1 hypothetical protein [Alphaproteobacteria bacterium]MBU4553273.1 hypothetical protein [Alphaproteobacteria bacterium]MBV1724347.1 hypothetical protein [Hoeflea sp.]MBV1763343.1 hypothetical protein [Hoeflea sp.]
MFDFARSVRFRSFPSLSGAAVLAVAAVVLSGCEVTETSGNTYRPGPVCPMNYDPVCAERRGQERTFPNACQARAEDWRVVSSGQCRAGESRDIRRDRDDSNRDFRDRPRDRTDRRDFDRNRNDNPVRDPRLTPRDRPDRGTPRVSPVAPGGACPQVVQEVCGQVGNRTRIFMNRCELLRAGANEVPAAQCRRGNR